MKRVSILRAFGLLVVLVAYVPRAAAQCAIELTDLTDWSTSVPSTSPAFRPFTYRAVASGATSSYEVFLSVRTRGSVFPLTYLTIVGTCPAANMCELRAWCIPEGAYDVSAAARCDGNNANVPSKVLPLDIDYEDPVVEITGTSKLPDGRYRIEFVWTQPTGLRAQSYSWNVQQRLGDGTYAPPVYSQTPDVTAAPGDRIGVTFSYCTDDQTRFAHDQAIVGAAPPTVSVSVLDGDGQSVEVGQAAAAPLRVRFTASDPSFNLASLSATFELISVPAGASGYGIGATAQSTSPVSYPAPVAADGTASATLVVGDQEGPYVVRVVSPLSQTGSAAIFTTIATGAPRFAFELPPGAPSERMLVRKHRDDDSYPSPYQIPRDPALRPRFRFPGVVTQGGHGVSRDVWLRVVDPKDSSAYVPSAQPDDNDDPSPKGVLLPSGCDTASCGATSGNPLRVVSDASGRVEVVLEGTDRYAGDNYQIEASFEPSFRCATAGPASAPNICAKSAIVTAWKRVYVAVNKMFRRGAFLTASVTPCGPPQICSIPVDNVCEFPNPPFRVRLIHAPQTEGLGGSGDEFWHEEVTISAVTGGSMLLCLGNQVRRGTLHLDAGQAIRNEYRELESINRQDRTYLADAVGVVTGVRAADYFVEDRSLVDSRVQPIDAPIFEAAFTETIWLTDRTVDSDDIAYDGVIPYKAMYFNYVIPGVGDTQREWTTRKWIRHAERFGRERNAFPNHQSLFLGTRHHASDSYGLTTAADGFNDTWLFLQTINSAAVAREALVHELAHQWRVNDRFFVANPDLSRRGHCDAAFGCGEDSAVPDVCHDRPAEIMPPGVFMFGRQALCLMTSTFESDPNNGNGEVAFHYVRLPNGQVDSEWLRIRRREEPVPQFENLDPRDAR